MKAAILHRQLVVGQPEVTLQPFQECWLEDSAAAIERVAGQPDEFRSSKPHLAGVIELRSEFFAGERVYWAGGRAVEERELHPRLRVMLPDELQHQQLIKIGIEQGPGNRVEFPVVVVPPLGEVHDHSLISSYAVTTNANPGQLSEAAFPMRV